MIQQREDLEREAEYLPDIRCPACGQTMKFEKQAYQFHNGIDTCDHCMARIQIRIGGVAFNPRRGRYHTDVPVAGVTGGMLLEAPVVVQPPVDVPISFLKVINSERIAQDARRHMLTASRQYAAREWRSAMLTCRSAVQAALRDRGVTDGPVGAMVDEAHKQGVIPDEFTRHACRLVTNAGGAAAHGSEGEGPDGRREALAVIGAAVTVLGRLAALPG